VNCGVIKLKGVEGLVGCVAEFIGIMVGGKVAG
jgi:hypothetical protein